MKIKKNIIVPMFVIGSILTLSTGNIWAQIVAPKVMYTEESSQAAALQSRVDASVAQANKNPQSNSAQAIIKSLTPQQAEMLNLTPQQAQNITAEQAQKLMSQPMNSAQQQAILNASSMLKNTSASDKQAMQNMINSAQNQNLTPAQKASLQAAMSQQPNTNNNPKQGLKTGADNPFMLCSLPKPCNLCQPLRSLYEQTCPSGEMSENDRKISNQAVQNLQSTDPSLVSGLMTKEKFNQQYSAIQESQNALNGDYGNRKNYGGYIVSPEVIQYINWLAVQNMPEYSGTYLTYWTNSGVNPYINASVNSQAIRAITDANNRMINILASGVSPNQLKEWLNQPKSPRYLFSSDSSKNGFGPSVYMGVDSNIGGPLAQSKLVAPPKQNQPNTSAISTFK
jgi:hypothetical protein